MYFHIPLTQNQYIVMSTRKNFRVAFLLFSLVTIFNFSTCSLVNEETLKFVPIEKSNFEIDTISGVDPITYSEYQYQVKKSHLFKDGIKETHRDTIQDGRVIRSFGMLDGKLYQLLELTYINKRSPAADGI